MAYDEEALNRIYDRTDGNCHVCRIKLSFVNYARPGRKGAWEVDHSRARARGGTNRLNNLYAACVPCNRAKSTVSSRAARARHGETKAPKSRAKRVKQEGAAAGAILGGLLGGLPGALAGAVLGDIFSSDDPPARRRRQ